MKNEEKFQVVDLKSSEYKGKKYYFLVCYSNLGYLVNVSINEELYNGLKNQDFTKFDINSKIIRLYNNSTGKFIYRVG